jgi:protease II
MLTGDTNPIRDIGHARFRDLYAKLENTNGPEFKAALETEQKRWKKQLHMKDVSQWSRRFTSMYEAALPYDPEFAHERRLWANMEVYIQHCMGYRKNIWIGHKTYKDIKTFGVSDDETHYFIIRDAGSGGEDLELCVYHANHDLCFKRMHIGEFAVFSDKVLFFQTTENRLRTPIVMYTDLCAANEDKMIYFDYDPRFQVELVQPEYSRDIFILRRNALYQQLGQIVRNTDGYEIRWLTDANGIGSLFPISSHYYGTNNGIYWIDKDIVLKLPAHHYVCDAFLYKSKIYINTISNCIMNIYVLDTKTSIISPLTTYTAPCTIEYLGFSKTPHFLLHQPNNASEIYTIDLELVKLFPEPLPLPFYTTGFATAADGTKIPYWYVSHLESPTKLIVSSYGAYGITARASYPIRWLPYLEQGYALVIAAPRGGRDNGDGWYDAGRTALRKRTTFEDTATVIETVQKRFRISPQQTIIYGRSAGGWVAAYIGLKYPHLVRAAYAEVPYVDVLRTTTNPSLPLTQLEYDEFGDPIRRPAEYKALKTLSPNNIVRVAPANAPFFIVRSALYDAQVLPYEVLKFSKQLHKKGWDIVVGFDMDGGHFTSPQSTAEIQGTDATIIDAVLQVRSTPRRTRNARTHWSNGKTRRRRRSS